MPVLTTLQEKLLKKWMDYISYEAWKLGFPPENEIKRMENTVESPSRMVEVFSDFQAYCHLCHMHIFSRNYAFFNLSYYMHHLNSSEHSRVGGKITKRLHYGKSRCSCDNQELKVNKLIMTSLEAAIDEHLKLPQHEDFLKVGSEEVLSILKGVSTLPIFYDFSEAKTTCLFCDCGGNLACTKTPHLSKIKAMLTKEFGLTDEQLTNLNHSYQDIKEVLSMLLPDYFQKVQSTVYDKQTNGVTCSTMKTYFDLSNPAVYMSNGEIKWIDILDSKVVFEKNALHANPNEKTETVTAESPTKPQRGINLNITVTSNDEIQKVLAAIKEVQHFLKVSTAETPILDAGSEKKNEETSLPASEKKEEDKELTKGDSNANKTPVSTPPVFTIEEKERFFSAMSDLIQSLTKTAVSKKSDDDADTGIESTSEAEFEIISEAGTPKMGGNEPGDDICSPSVVCIYDGDDVFKPYFRRQKDAIELTEDSVMPNFPIMRYRNHAFICTSCFAGFYTSTETFGRLWTPPKLRRHGKEGIHTEKWSTWVPTSLPLFPLVYFVQKDSEYSQEELIKMHLTSEKHQSDIGGFVANEERFGRRNGFQYCSPCYLEYATWCAYTAAHVDFDYRHFK